MALHPSGRPRRGHRLALAALLLATAPLGCTAAQPTARPEVRLAPIVAPGELPRRIGDAELLAAHHVTATDPMVGGISGACLVGDGRLFLLSDRSRLFEVAWDRPAAGSEVRPLLADRPLRAVRDREIDSEALSCDPDGRLLIADEGTGRLVPFAPDAAEASAAGRQLTPQIRAEPPNKMVEALARFGDGRLLAIGEGVDEASGTAPAALGTGEGKPWLALRYRPGDGFEATDLAVAGDRLFVIERQFSLFGGWHTRLATLPLAALPGTPDAVIEPQEIARIGGGTLGENYEALVARRQEDGSYELLLLSDDNFNAFQRTLMLRLRWTPHGKEARDGG